MKKFLAIILAFTILSLPMVTQCSATSFDFSSDYDWSYYDEYKQFMNDEEERASEIAKWKDPNVLVNKKQQIKEKFYELTGMKIKDGEPLYRANRDGFSAENFHEKCDGHSNTITIVKVQGGDIIGGYTNAKWASEGDETRDDKAFLFSLTQNKICKIRQEYESTAVYNFSRRTGPLFRWGLELNNYGKHYSYVGKKAHPSYYEENGDTPWTFIGYEKSDNDDIESTKKFCIDDWEVYEVE